MWISFGMLAASQTSSSSCWTTLSTPPRFRPGDSSSLSKRTGTRDVTLVCSPMRRKSTWIGRLETGWKSTAFGKVRCGLPWKSIITTEFMKWPRRKHLRQQLLLDVDRERLLLFAVNHGGDPAFAAQCTGGSLASPVARFGGQRQLFAHFRILQLINSPATPPGMTMAGEARAPRGGAPETQVCGARQLTRCEGMPRSARRTSRLSLPARWPAPTATNTVPGRLHPRRDPVGPARVPLGEHHPVGVGRALLRAGRACARTRSGRRASRRTACRPSPSTGSPSACRGDRLAGAPGAAAAARRRHAGEHVELQFERLEALDRLALGLGDVAQDHVGAIADLHALRPAGADRHLRGREEGGGRSHRQAAERRRSD